MALTRRTFLQSAAAVTSGVEAVDLFTSVGRVVPSDRLNVAMIGCGKMGNDYHIPQLLQQPDVQLVAVCDVDTTRREWAAARVNKKYSSSKQDFKGCSTYVDFRDVIAREDIDAVCIATPDHWHAIPLIEACKAGKDVYCEKPLTLTIAESKACIDATRKFKRIVQTGSQQRSGVFGPFREAIELIHSGRLGRIHRVTVGVGDPSIECGLPEEAMEPGLDWEPL